MGDETWDEMRMEWEADKREKQSNELREVLSGLGCPYLGPPGMPNLDHQVWADPESGADTACIDRLTVPSVPAKAGETDYATAPMTSATSEVCGTGSDGVDEERCIIHDLERCRPQPCRGEREAVLGVACDVKGGGPTPVVACYSATHH